MKGVGTDIGTIHFIGIGGIGMSGIAEVMHNLGYDVQGSDVAEGYVVEGLRAKGIRVMIGHKAENLGDAAVVVKTGAGAGSGPGAPASGSQVLAGAGARPPRARDRRPKTSSVTTVPAATDPHMVRGRGVRRESRTREESER